MGNRQLNADAFSFGTRRDDVYYHCMLEVDTLDIDNIQKQLEALNVEMLKTYIRDVMVALRYFVRIDGEDVCRRTKMYFFDTLQTRLLKIIIREAEEIPPHPRMNDKHYYRKCALHLMLAPVPIKR